MVKKADSEPTASEQDALDNSLVPEDERHDGIHGEFDPPVEEDDPAPEFTFHLDVDTTYTTTVDGEELNIFSGPDGVYVTIDPREIFSLKNVFGFAPQGG